MTSNSSPTITIWCPILLIDTFNLVAAFPINEGRWQDAIGAQFRLDSFIRDRLFDLSRLIAVVVGTRHLADDLLLAIGPNFLA
jgi:hypothetical protein